MVEFGAETYNWRTSEPGDEPVFFTLRLATRLATDRLERANVV